MNDLPSLGGAAAVKRIGDRRAVPGPKSKAIFDEEAKAMAPGLQSIALFSQIVVDHAKGCTITDVDGANISTSSPASRSAASATAIRTMSSA